MSESRQKNNYHSPKKSISVVIPNYNGYDLLNDNIPSVYEALQAAEIDYEFIVVDDASTDGSVALLREKFPDIKVIINEVNQGFSPTINRGIMAARKDLVFALNSDVKLSKDYFLPMMRYFEQEDTFGVMGKVLDPSGQRIQDMAKYPKQKFTQKINSTTNFTLDPIPEGFWIPTLFLSGSNALVRREKIQELEGFDELYAPFYGEDLDLSLRAWRLGWACYYEPEAICYHPESATIAAYHKKRKIYIISMRNKFILHALHLSGTSKLIWNLKLSLNFLSYWLVFNTRFYKAFFMFLGCNKQLKASKKRMSKLLKKYKRTASINQIIKKMQQDVEVHHVIKPSI